MTVLEALERILLALGIPPSEGEKLRQLGRSLTNRKCFEEQSGPYPATHGERHIVNVLKNIQDLITSAGISSRENNRVPELIAAAMIHDLGMVSMVSTGANGVQAQEARQRHAKAELIEELAKHDSKTAGFRALECDDIIIIASAHAGDLGRDAHTKLKEAEARNSELRLPILLLRLADYLDLGPDRLIDSAMANNWDEIQKWHLFRHATAQASISQDVIRIGLTWQAERDVKNILEALKKADGVANDGSRQALRRALSVMATLRQVYEEARSLTESLNKELRGNIHYKLEPPNEAMYGTIWPLSLDVELFGSEFRRALSDSPRELRIDMMGHSLYQRFVRDAEALNVKLKQMMTEGGVKLRIVLLDPAVENQQMVEVYDAQNQPGAEAGSSVSPQPRSILPRYSQLGILDREGENGLGDIRSSLAAIEKEWMPKAQGNSLLEVRVTRRLMYAGIVRFGNRMLVSPYRRGGQFDETGTLVLTDESPFYWAQRAEFESIWDSNDTRLHLHKTGRPEGCMNPLARRIRKRRQLEAEDTLDYERLVLGLERYLAAWFRETGTAPPYEIEFQPSVRCDLRCFNCIGQHLGRVVAPKPESVGRLAELKYLDSVFQWEEPGPPHLKIERIRISGLLGDPLHRSARECTLKLIKKAKREKREVVLFTNGVNLLESNVPEALLTTDYVHVSLDAATERTFSAIKQRSGLFQRICDNVESLCQGRRKRKSKTKIGLGFVVTQENASPHELKEFVDLATRLGVSFVRFKRDIRRTRAISWRCWGEARKVIYDLQNRTEGNPAIWLTDVPWGHEGPPLGEPCWAQRYCTTVGPDGFVYPCDHLTSSGSDFAIGNLDREPLQDILTKWVRKKGPGGASGPRCIQCPPFNSCVNPIFSELFALRGYGWDQVKEWISKAVNP